MSSSLTNGQAKNDVQPPHIGKSERASSRRPSDAGGEGKVENHQLEADPVTKELIRFYVVDLKTDGFDKKRNVASLIGEELEDRGSFFRTADGRQYYFHNARRQLYDLDQRPFQHLLTTVSGLSATEVYHGFTLDILQAATAEGAPIVHVHALAHYDPATGFLAVSNGESGVWYRERHGEWRYCLNSEKGLFFLTEPEAIAWDPVFGDDSSLRWYLDRFNFSNGRLSIQQQRLLLHRWMQHQFFPAYRPTRMIPAFLGPQGSTKTTAMKLYGRLLLGKKFNVTGFKKEDAFVAAITNGVVVAIDNADRRIHWLEDDLARYATGERIRMRRYYTTNEEVSFEPQAILLISSRDPQFNRPDVAERLLPFYCERPKIYVPEQKIFAELERRRGAIMGALLSEIGEIADHLQPDIAPSLPFRMADFAAFGWQVSDLHGKSKEWERLLSLVETVQADFASEEDGALAALAELLRQQGTVRDVPVRDLFKRCAAIAQSRGFLFPDNAQAFGRWLSNHSRMVELESGVRFHERRVHAGERRVSLIPQGGDDGGDGDGV